MSSVSGLLDTWASRAGELEPYAPAAAEAFRRARAELEAAIAEDADAVVDQQGAVAWSGYSERRLRQLVQEGRLQNVGRPGAPRYRKSDLPRKRRDGGNGSYDPASHAHRILAQSR